MSSLLDILKINAEAVKTYVASYVSDAFNKKQDKLTFDTTPTADSENPVTSGGTAAAIAGCAKLNEENNFNKDKANYFNGVVEFKGATRFYESPTYYNVINLASGADSTASGTLSSTQYSGNAATATKATQDGNGNVIADTYLINDCTDETLASFWQ